MRSWKKRSNETLSWLMVQEPTFGLYLCVFDSRLIATRVLAYVFFQAEDGIRDLIVTGVQTCALPILTHAVVAYDHARHAPLGDVITLDFINTSLEPGARAAIELTLETAKGLRAALDRAIAAAEFEEAEVRGKGAVPRSFGQRDTRDQRVARASAAAVAVGERPPVKRHTENPTYL